MAARNNYAPRPGTKAAKALSILSLGGPLTLTELGRRIDAKGSAWNYIDPMVRRGIVVKIADDDGTVKYAASEGETVAADAAPATPRRPTGRKKADDRAITTPARAEPAAALPIAAETGIAFGLYSDGDLLLARGEETFHLAAAETRALLGYLTTQRTLLARVFVESE
jgi:hypothetical protein